ncbi:acylphosphatase [Psychromonas ossibalaenae]|uniref:acylphosphatase n=1 Tax=Psychromonas ossibalaenae TaxID=444922 RepID=UPI00037E826F|nr:acylphosphatase [Psychromonas ossibalaenae]
MENIGCKVMVSGMVQGVGFRYFTCREACKYGLVGHAKNLYGGEVEVLMFGNREAISKMLAWLENGPKTARVDELKVNEIPYRHKEEFLCL